MYLCCLTTIYYLLYLLFVNVIIKVLKLTQWLHILRPKSNCFLMMTRRRWDKTTHAPSSGPDRAHCSLAGWERESWLGLQTKVSEDYSKFYNHWKGPYTGDATSKLAGWLDNIVSYSHPYPTTFTSVSQAPNFTSTFRGVNACLA